MGRLLVAMLVVLAVCCSPAQAATTVAKSGDYSLRAREKGGRLCITLIRDRRNYQGMACGRIPRSPQRPLAIFPDTFTYHYAAAVPPSVRIAEAEDRKGRRTRHRTFRARGFSARFVLIPSPPIPVFVRFHGARDTLLGMDAGSFGYITMEDDEARVFGEPGHDVTVHTEPRIAPTPDQADRIRTLACADSTNGNAGSGWCTGDAENFVTVAPACDVPDLVSGIVSADVERVRLTLGTGGELDLESRDLPAAFGGRRVFAGPVPGREAIRAAAALDASGVVVARRTLGTAPGGQCPGEDQGNDNAGGDMRPTTAPLGAVPVATAAGASLVAADRDETLCVAFGALRARVCPPPPVDSDRPRLQRRGGAVGGVLSRDAARITLRLDRGRPVTLATTDGPAYTGHWAGKVRFFAAAVDPAREVAGAVVRNAAGAVIGVSERGIVRRRTHRRVVAERDGRGVQVVRRTGEQPCLTPFAADLPPAGRLCFDPDPGTPIDGPFYLYRGSVIVPCAPRLAFAYGRMPDDRRAPEVLLDGGRSVRARRLAFPGDDGWVAFLPDTGVRGLKGGRSKVPLRLPPASEQCGYSLFRAF
jgi:hypothetical protein